jgi:two-component system, chemotaxis family, CheB/CheR fusion protein
MQGLSVTGFLFTAPTHLSRSIEFLSGRRNYFSQISSETSDERENRRSALVVDDVMDVTEMLSVLLTHAGYEVVTAASARAALAVARNKHFDVVISDIGMPEMNGYELARALRALPDYQNVPLVAVTGYSMFDDRERSLSSGFNAHMTKPIDPRALLDRIDKL